MYTYIYVNIHEYIYMCIYIYKYTLPSKNPVIKILRDKKLARSLSSAINWSFNISY
jgi:hypothetical protein